MVTNALRLGRWGLKRTLTTTRRTSQILQNRTECYYYYTRSISILMNNDNKITPPSSTTHRRAKTASFLFQQHNCHNQHQFRDASYFHLTRRRANTVYSPTTATRHSYTTTPPHSRRHDTNTTITTQTNNSQYTTPTFFELVRAIPIGLKHIYRDIQTYRLINDASRTVNNAWTKTPGKHQEGNDGDDQVGRIPRRQREFQRRLLRELHLVSVPLALSLVPVLGNLFVLCVVLAPRYFLSDRFFLKQSHVRSLRAIEWERRKGWMERCAIGFWREYGGVMVETTEEHLWSLLVDEEEKDEAGPVIRDLVPLYDLFYPMLRCRSASTNDTNTDKATKVPNLSTMNRDHLLTLAQTTPISSPVLPLLPRFYITYRLKSLLHDICDDDLLLIEQQKQCLDGLTDKEVMDACALRGLPTEMGIEGEGIEDMREYLENYLKMVKMLVNAVGKRGYVGDEKEGSGLFVLYLPAIRYSWKTKMKTKVKVKTGGSSLREKD